MLESISGNKDSACLRTKPMMFWKLSEAFVHYTADQRTQHTWSFWFPPSSTGHSVKLLTFKCRRGKQVWIGTLHLVGTQAAVLLGTVEIACTVVGVGLDGGWVCLAKVWHLCCKVREDREVGISILQEVCNSSFSNVKKNHLSKAEVTEK